MSALFTTLFICLQTLLGTCRCNCPYAQAQSDSKMDDTQMTAGVNGFGFDVFRTLADSYGCKDIFISPSSLAMALAMTAGGAEGQTYGCMTSTMGLGLSGKEQVAAYFKRLAGDLAAADKDCTLETANSIWIHNSLRVKDGFIRSAEQYYDAMAASRDFGNPATTAEINRWCSDHTDGKIPFIVKDLSGGLMMALLNALYFKGSWNFDWRTTDKRDFTACDGNVSKVDMMHTGGHFLYGEDELFQMVELPYGNASFVLDILLPKDPAGFKEAVQSLNGARWEAFEGNLSMEYVKVALPKFTMEYDIELTKMLGGLGMGTAFSDDADFSGISDTPLKISIVKQKTFVEVNEQGTEAAAVTFIGMKTTAVGPARPAKNVIADRPFVFLIRERGTGAVLFVGQKTQPQK